MRPSYQKIPYQSQPPQYTIHADLNDSKILTVNVFDNQHDTEYKQEFTPMHFKNANIMDVSKILSDAIKPSNFDKRCKIFTPDTNWLYLTVDNGSNFKSLALANIDNYKAEDTYSRAPSTVAPRHYTTTQTHTQLQSGEILSLSPNKINKYESVPQNNGDIAEDSSNSDDDVIADLFSDMTPLEVTSGQLGEPKYKPVQPTKPKRNDIIRIFGWFAHLALIVFTLFLAAVCYLYSVAQLYAVRMSNLWCEDNQTLEQIREYNSNNANVLGEEYSCYQTHGNFIDYHRLFDPNAHFGYESIMEYGMANQVFSVIFLIVCILFVLVVIWDVLYIITFVLCHQMYAKDREDECSKCWNKLCSKWFSLDMKWWVIGKFILQTIQIIIQSILLLNYGGIDIFNLDNVDLRIELPWIIICFAVIIMCYALLMCVLWNLYTLFPKTMFGFKFAATLFIIDAIFVIIFAEFPFVIHNDQISKHPSIGVLHMNTIQFVATVYPLILLVFKCYIALKFTHSLSYKGVVNKEAKDPMARVRKFSVLKSMHTARRHSKEIKYDFSPLFIKIHFEDMEQFAIGREQLKVLKKQDCCSRVCLTTVAVVLLGLSCLISCSVIVDIENSKRFCNQSMDTAINPNIVELMVYDDVCKRKIYKLFDEYPCNCEVVVFGNEMMTDSESKICQIHENNIRNITGIDVLNNVFLKWNRMNRFFLDQQRSTANEIIYGCIQNEPFALEKEIFSSQFMELVYIRNLYIDSITSEIANDWKRLQFLAIPNTVIDAGDVSFEGIALLTELKALYLDNIDGLELNNGKYISLLCPLNNTLQSLQIENSYFENVDECFVDFVELKYLLLNYDGVNEVNWDVLNIATLKRLSLYASALPFESLNDQIIPSNIYTDNPVLESVYLGGNTPVCASYTQFNSESAIAFINHFNACEDGCSEDCPIYNEADGFCQPECNIVGDCNFDSGDCNQ